MSQWIMLEYFCPVCQSRLESLEDRELPSEWLPHCDTKAHRTVSAVMGRVKLGEVTRGRNDSSLRPPHVMDTRPLAEGMPTGEWKRRQAKRRVDTVYSQLKKEI